MNNLYQISEVFTKQEEQEKQNKLLDEALKIVEEKQLDGIAILASPDYINKDSLKLLKNYKVRTIELVSQTTNNYILGICKTTYTFEDIQRASKLIRRHRFVLGHQMRIGLPDSTRLDDLKTAKDLVKLKPKMISIYPVLVLKGTELAEEFETREYAALNLNQAVERCKELYYFFTKKKIDTIHIGLQKENVDKRVVLAGPYHEFFGQLVEDGIWYDSIVERIKKFNVKVKEVEIVVNPQNAVNVVGYNNENVDKLKELYDVDIVLTKDEQRPIGKFDIKILKTYSDFLEENKSSK